MSRILGIALLALAAGGPRPRTPKPAPASVTVNLSERKVELSEHESEVSDPLSGQFSTDITLPSADWATTYDDLVTQYNQARAAGDGATAFALKNQIDGMAVANGLTDPIASLKETAPGVAAAVNAVSGALDDAATAVGSGVKTLASATGGPRPRTAAPAPASVTVQLSEWKVKLSQQTVATGAVAFSIANAGAVPHAFEIEGRGMERETGLVQPGDTASLTLVLGPGTYDVYCPVGRDAHKKLGMLAHLTVGAAGSSY